jgi:hypothetical protein
MHETLGSIPNTSSKRFFGKVKQGFVSLFIVIFLELESLPSFVLFSILSLIRGLQK